MKMGHLAAKPLPEACEQERERKPPSRDEETRKVAHDWKGENADQCPQNNLNGHNCENTPNGNFPSQVAYGFGFQICVNEAPSREREDRANN